MDSAQISHSTLEILRFEKQEKKRYLPTPPLEHVKNDSFHFRNVIYFSTAWRQSRAYDVKEAFYARTFLTLDGQSERK
jgi:hypothetical protein